MTLNTISLQPVGFVRSQRREPIDDGWDRISARIELDADQFTSEALLGLDTFSHVDVIYYFNQVRDAKIERGARHPRGNTDWPRIGIFSQRGKNRPNRLGHTTCKVSRVDGLTLHVEGLDAIDGTPVLDLKPVMSGFLPRGDVREPDWSLELMRGYWI
jgi:tRNA-Thr(GGU) m(6)t(6)A37 methyltransferase TsaA